MTAKRPSQRKWMRQTIEQSVVASLRRRISPDDLLDEEWLQFQLWDFIGRICRRYRIPALGPHASAPPKIR